MKDNKFYEELGKVPELSDELFGKIENKIEQKKSQRYRIWAIAASVILAFGILFYNVKDNFNTVSSSVAMSDEVVEELQIIDDYLSGPSVDDEMELYAYSGIY